MSKASSTPPTKRRRIEFGAPTEDDGALLSQPSYFPSTTALSTRIVPQKGTVPPLSSLAARRFVLRLSQDDRLWAHSKRYLRRLPDALVPRLFSMLRSTYPTLLSHSLIVLYFLRGPSLVLSGDLPGVQRQTIASIVHNAGLRELHLTGFDKFADTVFSSILPSLPHLRILVLRGCSKIGPKTAEAIGNACVSLTTLNLNYTSVSPASLIGPLTSCNNLEVLKVAGIPRWTDNTFANLLAGLGDAHLATLPHMKSIKFRQLDLSESSILPFLARCPNLTRLDVSFTRVHRLSPLTVTPPPLEKLSITSTAFSSADILSLISVFPNIRTLYLGALDNGQGTWGSTRKVATKDPLVLLTDILENFVHLEKLSLVGNAKLGLTSGPGSLADFVCRVGRKCKHLNLSGLPYLLSHDLCGLISETDGTPRLEQLALNHTGIDDDAVPFLACCSLLTVLEVAGTKMTSDGLFTVIDGCPSLAKLDLTSCRGIRVADRRRFFEVWESERSET